MKVKDLTKDTILVGTKGLSKEDQEVLNKLIKDNFEDTNVVFLGKRAFGAALDTLFRESEEWKEQAKMSEFISNPENLLNAMKQADHLRENVQDVVSKDALRVESFGFFTLTEIVENTNLTYKGAKPILDLLFVFGFLGKTKIQNREMYTVTVTDEEKITFLEYQKMLMENDLKEFDEAIKFVKDSKTVV